MKTSSKNENAVAKAQKERIKQIMENEVGERHGAIKLFAKKFKLRNPSRIYALVDPNSNHVPEADEMKIIADAYGYSFDWVAFNKGPEKIVHETDKKESTEEALRAELKKKDCELIELKAELRVCERVIDRLIAKLTRKNKGDYKGIIGEAVKKSRAAKDPH